MFMRGLEVILATSSLDLLGVLVKNFLTGELLVN